MNHLQDYWRELDDLRRVAGADNEGGLRRAFENLLRDIGQEQQLILYSEYPFKSANGASLRADGVLVDRLRLVHGWWEAKDEKDDLDKEIAAKLAKGYPSDNLIFEDTRSAVLLQQGREVMRCAVSDGEKLQRLLDSFFTYQLPEVANFRLARDKFMIELPGVSAALSDLLREAHLNNPAFKAKAREFLKYSQHTIGKRFSVTHADEMLIQHILTDQIFRAVFPLSNFHQENHLAYAIGELEKSFLRGETRMNLLKRLEPYFAAIRQAAANTVTSIEKQEFLKQVYEDFYSAYNPKDADKLGVVYTPHEAVRFIIEACDWLAQKHFGKRLAEEGLDILDPCTGTGTFIVDLIDYFRGDRQALECKFDSEIHANEISILPYYIACLNIEQTYYEATGHWREFKGACFVNTLENWGFELTHKGATNDLFGGITEENQARIKSQNTRKIPVIFGNPPYNANQQNENDNNKNDPAPQADKRIKETYVAQSTAQKTKLYDPYVRFLRWASDRIGEQGMIGFITNRSYLDSRQADGLRKTLAREFQEIWIVDLMSDVRKNPKISGTKHNIFGIQTGVAIVLLVRNPKLDDCEIHYLSLDDFLPALEKRRWLRSNHVRRLAKAGEFRRISPNARGDWLNQAREEWGKWLAIASKQVKNGEGEEAIFKLHSLGLATNRDDWVYGRSNADVEQKVRYFIDSYERKRLNPRVKDGGIKWTRAVKNDFSKNIPYRYDSSCITEACYRPFVMRKLYFNSKLNEMQARQKEIFGLKQKNCAICISATSSAHGFSTLAIANLPDLHFCGDTETLAFWSYDEAGSRHDNITDWALQQFQQHYGDAAIAKIHIFHYVYAVLHDPRYREKFALNLKAEFPRIPFHPGFWAWAEIGAKLIELHANFEQVKPWGLEIAKLTPGTPAKCRLKADKAAGVIEIDSETALLKIPPQAWEYQLGNRSALEWIVDQYKEKTPKDPTIREKFNTYRFADHKETVIALLDKVCRVSVDTMALVEKIKTLAWME
jgi:predicted helicase